MLAGAGNGGGQDPEPVRSPSHGRRQQRPGQGRRRRHQGRHCNDLPGRRPRAPRPRPVTTSTCAACRCSLIYRVAERLPEKRQPGKMMPGQRPAPPGHRQVIKDCKVWEFKLRDGLKYEDGTAITVEGRRATASPVASPTSSHARARTTSSSGSTRAADYNASLQGPLRRADRPAGTSTPPDDKTIISSRSRRRHCRPAVRGRVAADGAGAAGQGRHSGEVRQPRPVLLRPVQDQAYTR